MTRYPCSGCGKMSCDGRCFLECAADYQTEADPLEAEKIAEQVKRAEAFWERHQAERADLEPKKRPDGRWEIAA